MRFVDERVAQMAFNNGMSGEWQPLSRALARGVRHSKGQRVLTIVTGQDEVRTRWLKLFGRRYDMNTKYKISIETGSVRYVNKEGGRQAMRYAPG